MRRLYRTSASIGINLLRNNSSLTFVPRHSPVDEQQLEKLQVLIDNSSNILVLTGAGISTESGIPDYRSESVGLYARSNHRPIQHQDFVKSRNVRQRYWARNFVGWETFSSVTPNTSHLVLSKWEQLGKTSTVVTQNVDRLHHKAGNKFVIELHGSAYDVKCMNCSHNVCRHDFQAELSELNSYLSSKERVEMRPDADVELPQELINNFRVPDCPKCHTGFFKPDIVFFGDNVPKPRVDHVFSELAASDCLLVIGSSLHVYSGYRFILRATELRIPIAIVNIGPTRGDEQAYLKLNAKCSEVLSKLCV